MPSLNYDFLWLLRDNYKNYPIFIETGTYKGDTIFAMEPHFEKLHTIEIHEQFWHDSYTSYTGNKIQFYWADTEKILPDILPTLDKDTIFFLDSHWSGVDTGLGSQAVPLYEELRAINNLFLGRAILIIDDFRLFETEHWEIINKSRVLECVLGRVDQVYHLPSRLDDRDRLVIHLAPARCAR
jgi:hypothetical protein